MSLLALALHHRKVELGLDNPQVGAWSNVADSPNDFLLMRMYRDATVTGERCINGVYQGEYPLTAEAFDFGSAS